jgi:hypothetical protein
VPAAVVFTSVIAMHLQYFPGKFRMPSIHRKIKLNISHLQPNYFIISPGNPIFSHFEHGRLDPHLEANLGFTPAKRRYTAGASALQMH